MENYAIRIGESKSRIKIACYFMRSRSALVLSTLVYFLYPALQITRRCVHQGVPGINPYFGDL